MLPTLKQAVLASFRDDVADVNIGHAVEKIHFCVPYLPIDSTAS